MTTMHNPANLTVNHAWTGSTYLNLIEPDPADLVMDDIITGLCGMRRYNRWGTMEPWSVGQHSLSCLYWLEEDAKLGLETAAYVLPKGKLALLLHDAPEAPLGDMVRPLKIVMPEYRAIEDRMYSAIAQRWGLPDPLPGFVKHYDDLALSTEKAFLVHPDAGSWGALPAPRPEGLPRHLLGASDRHVEIIFEHTVKRLIGQMNDMDGTEIAY